MPNLFEIVALGNDVLLTCHEPLTADSQLVIPRIVTAHHMFLSPPLLVPLSIGAGSSFLLCIWS